MADYCYCPNKECQFRQDTGDSYATEFLGKCPYCGSTLIEWEPAKDMPEWTIDFESIIVSANTEEEAREIALKHIKDGEVRIDQVLKEGT